jgi:hypothetical protein
MIAEFTTARARRAGPAPPLHWHFWAVQMSAWHCTQATPPVPHIPFEVPARQIPLSAQQPPGHDTPSQTQALLTQ